MLSMFFIRLFYLELMSLPSHYKSLSETGSSVMELVLLYDGAVSPEKTESNSKSLVSAAAGRRQEQPSLFIKIYDNRLHSYDGNSTFITFHSDKFPKLPLIKHLLLMFLNVFLATSVQGLSYNSLVVARQNVSIPSVLTNCTLGS